MFIVSCYVEKLKYSFLLEDYKSAFNVRFNPELCIRLRSERLKWL